MVVVDEVSPGPCRQTISSVVSDLEAIGVSNGILDQDLRCTVDSGTIDLHSGETLRE
jgi:hypothetical protein